MKLTCLTEGLDGCREAPEKVLVMMLGFDI